MYTGFFFCTPQSAIFPSSDPDRNSLLSIKQQHSKDDVEERNISLDSSWTYSQKMKKVSTIEKIHETRAYTKIHAIS
jgi:hypothetical protein